VDRLAASKQNFEQFLGSQLCAASEMLNQVGAQDKKIIREKSTSPRTIDQLVYSGPHLACYNPYFQETAPVAKSNRSYVPLSLSDLQENYIIQSSYELLVEPESLDDAFPRLGTIPYRKLFRLATRGMINPANERSLFLAIIPPGPLHINAIKSVGSTNLLGLLVCAGFGGSLILDGYLRLKNKTNIFTDDIKAMPIGNDTSFYDSIARRALVLNGLTRYYNELWTKSTALDRPDKLTNGHLLVGFGKPYSKSNPLRGDELRRVAQCELDALVALSFGLTEQDLAQLYEILFPVMSEYDRKESFYRRDLFVSAYNYFMKRGW
jgi:hypothetical protein